MIILVLRTERQTLGLNEILIVQSPIECYIKIRKAKISKIKHFYFSHPQLSSNQLSYFHAPKMHSQFYWQQYRFIQCYLSQQLSLLYRKHSDMNKGRNIYQEQCRYYEKTEQHQQHEANKKNPSKIIINVSDTQYPVVKQTAKTLQWIQSTEPFTHMNFDVCWTDSHVKPETFYKMNQYQRINHFPGMDILSRKNNLGKNLMNFRNRFPAEFQFFPHTWMLPHDFADLKRYHGNRHSQKTKTFIVKPEANSQGRGIFLTRNLQRLKGQKCVVQRYIHKPFLIDGLKFDMRIYVLIAGTDPLRIFIYQQGLARFSTEPYMPPRADNLQNKFMHLTNYAINKNNPNFIFNESILQSDKGHKRTLSSIYKHLRQMGHDVNQLQQRIEDIIIKTVITGYPTISRIQKSVHPQNYANDMCFEILGLDVMLDCNLNPILLEVNYTPSFATDTPLDKHVKQNLIADTLKLIGITQQWKHSVKKQREAEVIARILLDKRKKLALDQQVSAVQSFARQRDLYESDHLGGYTKIFVKCKEQFQQYRKYYEFAESLYLDQNRLLGTINSNNYFYIPFLKDNKSAKQKKSKRKASINQGMPKSQNTKAFHSIYSSKVVKNKSTLKKTVICSSKNLHTPTTIEVAKDNYIYQNQPIFANSSLREVFKTKSKLCNIYRQRE